MEILIEIGGVRFLFDSDCDIIVEDAIAPFFSTRKDVNTVNIRLIHDFSDAPLPTGPMLGDDVLMEYYRQGEQLLCLTKGGQGTYLSSCLCSPDLREMTCWLNFPAGSAVDTLGNLIRMIPLRRILLQSGVLFFHASQIALGGTGILFTAPSGTGKTTQARLWREFRGAEILCNDRTLTDGVITYGFPVDGSEPVCSSEQRRLGAIVVLAQAPENAVRRLKAREVLPRLLPQLVLDIWDPNAAALASGLLLDLIPRTPVYLLECTPDESAVQCLEQQLHKDGVIPYAENPGPYL